MCRRSGDGAETNPGSPRNSVAQTRPSAVRRAEQHEALLGRESTGQLGELPVDASTDPRRVGLDAGPLLHRQLALVVRAHQKNPQDGAPAIGATRPAAPVGL